MGISTGFFNVVCMLVQLPVVMFLWHKNRKLQDFDPPIFGDLRVFHMAHVATLQEMMLLNQRTRAPQWVQAVAAYKNDSFVLSKVRTSWDFRTLSKWNASSIIVAWPYASMCFWNINIHIEQHFYILLLYSLVQFTQSCPLQYAKHIFPWTFNVDELPPMTPLEPCMVRPCSTSAEDMCKYC